MKLIGLISPNLSEDTLVDVYKILPNEIRIEGRALNVGSIPMMSSTEPSKLSRTSSAIGSPSVGFSHGHG